MLTIGCRRFSVLAICLITWFSTPVVFAQTLYDFNLPPQALADSLRAIGHQTSVNILFDPRSVEKLAAPAVHGQFSASQAVNRILAGTNLAAEQTEANTLLVEPKDKAGKAQAATALNDPLNDSQKEAGKNSSQDFRVAQANQANAGPQAVDDQNSEKKKQEGLSEIIVTAQKKSERLQDVPVPITVISGDQLAQSNELRIQDYYNTVPGLNVSPMGLHSVVTLSMRGITTGSFGNSPVAGVTLDDVPLGPSTSVGGGVIAPDLDPSDLARIEVLKGPQGTLYGASSLGGLLKYVTVDPSLSGFSGMAEAGTETIHGASDSGYTFRGAVNAPLGETIAIRASGYTQEDPGYIDNPVYNFNDINKTRSYGGLLSTLWSPLDTFSLKLSALYQDRKADGSSDVDLNENGYAGPKLGDLQQNYIPGIGGFEKKVEAYAATARLQVGSINLTSVTGYNVSSYFDSFDFTYDLGPYNGYYGFPSADGDPLLEHGITNKFSQELRLSMPLGSRIDWLFGVFYTHESSRYEESILATDIATSETIGSLYSNPDDTSIFKEYAAFTDLTFHITDRFDVQVGGRESHIQQSTAYFVETGPATGAPNNVAVNNPTATSYSPFTYLFTPRYRFSDDLMVYARLASGYRAGGGGAQGATAICVVHNFPCSYAPDKTYNYEVGVKGSALEHALNFDASVYYIDWKDIQVNAVLDGLYGYISNGGSARSDGAELSLDWRPIEALTLSARTAYTDAVLTQNFPGFPNGAVYGTSGNRLPDTSRFTGYLAAERSFTLTSAITAMLGADERYIGSHIGQFLPAEGTRQYFSPYSQTDAHASLKYDTWLVTAYANNVTDRRGALAGGLGTYPPFAFTYIQPRTIGLTLRNSF